MLVFDNVLWAVVLALLIDAVVGDPDRLWRRLPHPVVLFGRAITLLDNHWNEPPAHGVAGRRRGLLAIVCLLAGAAAAGLAIELALDSLPLGTVWTAIVGAVFIAQRCLYDHVRNVARTLDYQGVPEARRAVSRIVGRNPDNLDESGVSRAAIESLAENYSDGVVAPVLWFALFGLPGLFAYKMLNTADSMIGYRSERYRSFGWASARLDDLANWPAARLSALIVWLAAPLVRDSAKRAVEVVRSDAGKHRSPNAGWPEAAFAGALDVALSGPRDYDSGPTDDPFVNADGRRLLGANEIDRALRLFVAACGVQFAALSVIALAV